MNDDSSKLSDRELLNWVTELIAREQDDRTYGTIQIHMKNGKITSARVERSHLPATK